MGTFELGQQDLLNNPEPENPGFVIPDKPKKFKPSALTEGTRCFIDNGKKYVVVNEFDGELPEHRKNPKERIYLAE